MRRWETFSAHDNYVSWRTERGDLDEAGDLLEDGFEAGLQTYEWGTKTDL